jgi:hypothetical protein
MDEGPQRGAMGGGHGARVRALACACCVCVIARRRVSSCIAASRSSSRRGIHADCHQPLYVRRLPLWCGETVVTKWAERVVTEKSTRVLNEAGYVATAWSCCAQYSAPPLHTVLRRERSALSSATGEPKAGRALTSCTADHGAMRCSPLSLPILGEVPDVRHRALPHPVRVRQRVVALLVPAWRSERLTWVGSHGG